MAPQTKATKKRWSEGEQLALRKAMRMMTYKEAIEHHMAKFSRPLTGVLSMWAKLQRADKAEKLEKKAERKNAILDVAAEGLEIATFPQSEYRVAFENSSIKIFKR
jgi:hypothetical protein